MRNIFLEKWYTKCGGETSPWAFSEKLKLSIYLDQYSKVFYSFIGYQIEGYQIETKLRTTSFYLILSLFKE